MRVHQIIRSDKYPGDEALVLDVVAGIEGATFVAVAVAVGGTMGSSQGEDGCILT